MKRVKLITILAVSIVFCFQLNIVWARSIFDSYRNDRYEVIPPSYENWNKPLKDVVPESKSQTHEGYYWGGSLEEMEVELVHFYARGVAYSSTTRITVKDDKLDITISAGGQPSGYSRRTLDLKTGVFTFRDYTPIILEFSPTGEVIYRTEEEILETKQEPGKYAEMIDAMFETIDKVSTWAVEDVQKADLNGDGKVNFIDLFKACLIFGAREGDNRYDAKIDVNDDGIINIRDLSYILGFFNQKTDNPTKKAALEPVVDYLQNILTQLNYYWGPLEEMGVKVSNPSYAPPGTYQVSVEDDKLTCHTTGTAPQLESLRTLDLITGILQARYYLHDPETGSDYYAIAQIDPDGSYALTKEETGEIIEPPSGSLVPYRTQIERIKSTVDFLIENTSIYNISPDQKASLEAVSDYLQNILTQIEPTYYWGGSLEELDVGTGYPFEVGKLGKRVTVKDNNLKVEAGVGGPHTHSVYSLDLVTGTLEHIFYGDGTHLEISPTGEYVYKNIPVSGEDIGEYVEKIEYMCDIVITISSEIGDPEQKAALASAADYLQNILTQLNYYWGPLEEMEVVDRVNIGRPSDPNHPGAEKIIVEDKVCVKDDKLTIEDTIPYRGSDTYHLDLISGKLEYFGIGESLEVLPTGEFSHYTGRGPTPLEGKDPNKYGEAIKDMLNTLNSIADEIEVNSPAQRPKLQPVIEYLEDILSQL